MAGKGEGKIIGGRNMKDENPYVPISLPTIELTKNMWASVDKKLKEVRIIQYFALDDRQIIFVPMENIRKLCREVV
jgi:hypothetical protein